MNQPKLQIAKKYLFPRFAELVSFLKRRGAWIALLNDLQATGYQNRSKLLTPSQINLIETVLNSTDRAELVRSVKKS